MLDWEHGGDRWERKMARMQEKMERMRGRMDRVRSRGDWFGPTSSGNRAFDDYRSETLKRLEDEQREFKDFLARLRFAKDRAEFDQFMAERRQRPVEPDSPARAAADRTAQLRLAEPRRAAPKGGPPPFAGQRITSPPPPAFPGPLLRHPAPVLRHSVRARAAFDPGERPGGRVRPGRRAGRRGTA